MKNKSLSVGFLLFSSTSLYANSGTVYKVKKGDDLNLILSQFIDYKVGPNKNALVADILKHNQFIKNPNLIYPGSNILLPDLHDIIYEVKKGDSIYSIVKEHKHLAPHLKLNNQIEKTIAANPHIKNPDIIEVGDKIYLGKAIKSQTSEELAKNSQRGEWKHIDRAIASIKKNQPRYFYPDELGFEIHKMKTDEAREYISHFHKLTKTKSAKEWKSIFRDVMTISSNESHENVERAFYLYSIDIEEDGNIERARREVKAFLEVWKDARRKNFRL